jgi:acyl carrier protein|tara:strand:- start:1273 stop:1506 length:234 start_codon:yes stop_codon:yes gene_type:complete
MLRNKIVNILKKLFPKINIKNKKKNYFVGDFEDWDSLGNLNFLMSLEKKFKIRFTLNEMSELKSLWQIEKVIKKKIK